MGLSFPKSLTWTKGFTSKIAYSYIWQVNVHCALKVSVLFHVVLSIGLFECSIDRVVGIPPTLYSPGKGMPYKKANVLADLRSHTL